MSDFSAFNTTIQQQMKLMQDMGEWFRVDVNKDEVWEMYLASFPEGTNPIFRERTQHDCNCCKQFIRDVGSVVAIDGNKLVSIWDVTGAKDEYAVVAEKMAEFIKSKSIANVYRHYQQKIGTVRNFQNTEDGEVIEWKHFNAKLDSSKVVNGRSVGDITGELRTNYEVLTRSLEEITSESIDIVTDLIAQNSIYRGAEFKPIITKLKKIKKAYGKTDSESEREIFLWKHSTELGFAGRFKNTVIGTLLSDISDGVELEDAVRMYESKVAPQNYKRSSALITKGMIDKAQKKVEELGIGDSLQRRYAVEDDITINNVLFADRTAKKQMKGVFDDLAPTKKTNVPNMDKVQEITIEDFVENVIPEIDSMEVYLKNAHMSNFVSLIAPENEDSKEIFKWDNNFSWSYAGEVTDSIKERVKSAGGNVEGDVRVSLSWFNYDDLDLHVIEPGGNEIYYGSKTSRSTGGRLDVDMNAGGGNTREAVENIFWKRESDMKEGIYTVNVHNYSKREAVDVGFDIEFDVLGDSSQYHYDKAVGDRRTVTVLQFSYSKREGIKVVEAHVPSESASKEMWNVSTEQFQKVKMLMASPNHWDGQEIGNKHWFFMLDECYNPDSARGFYNEFLKNELNPHRKVFEVLSSKLKTPETDKQLSGVGFSSTKKAEILCKVGGSFNRMLKITF